MFNFLVDGETDIDENIFVKLINSPNPNITFFSVFYFLFLIFCEIYYKSLELSFDVKWLLEMKPQYCQIFQ